MLVEIIVNKRKIIEWVLIWKAYYVLDELLIAGELQESSKKTIIRLIDTQV